MVPLPKHNSIMSHPFQFIHSNFFISVLTRTYDILFPLNRRSDNINLYLLSLPRICPPPLADFIQLNGKIVRIVKQIVLAHFFKDKSHIIGKILFYGVRIDLYNSAGINCAHINRNKPVPEPEKVIRQQIDGLFSRFLCDRSFLSDSTVRENPDVVETGYEAAFDYEAVLALEPDVVLAYTVSSVEPPYLSRLRSLGVRVFILYDHLEHHPLARAEYVRLAGALTGRQELADSVFNDVSEKYLALAASVSGTAASAGKTRVLLNLPYSDMWYVPGAESYMSCLIRDAGGMVLGAEPGSSESSVISMEKAYDLSRDADFWLNTGNCTSRNQIEAIHPLFSRFGPMSSPHSVFNNVARVNEAGGNDFWESGAVHPELILSDLISIFGGKAGKGTLHYYVEVE